MCNICTHNEGIWRLLLHDFVQWYNIQLFWTKITQMIQNLYWKHPVMITKIQRVQPDETLLGRKTLSIFGKKMYKLMFRVETLLLSQENVLKSSLCTQYLIVTCCHPLCYGKMTTKRKTLELSIKWHQINDLLVA